MKFKKIRPIEKIFSFRAQKWSKKALVALMEVRGRGFLMLIKKAESLVCQGFRLGSPCWTRTNDPAVNSRMLYRLS